MTELPKYIKTEIYLLLVQKSCWQCF